MSEAIAVIDERAGWTSASNAEYDELCAGRHLAQVGIPDDDKSEYAQTGSRVHDALAKRDPAGLSLEERETYDATVAIEEKLVQQFFGLAAAEAAKRVWREQRFWAQFQDQATGAVYRHSGKPDVVYRHSERALIIEYKTLKGDVPRSPLNLQLRDQAVLVRGQFVVVADVGAAVIQPLVTHNPQMCIYQIPHLDMAAAKLFERVRASNQPNAPRTAGERQCAFCKAKNQCVEYATWNGSRLPVVVEPMVQAGLFQVAMANWSPEQRATAAGMIGPAGDFLEQIKEFLKGGLAKDPEFVPGWCLKPGNKRETVNDPQKVFERFTLLGGKVEQFMQCISIVKGKLKEQVNEVTGARGKALESAIDTLFDGLVVTTQNAPSLKKVGE